MLMYDMLVSTEIYEFTMRVNKCTIDDAANHFRLLSVNSTYAYQAPPANVKAIPTAFVALIERSNIDTASNMVRTCLTLARIHEDWEL